MTSPSHQILSSRVPDPDTHEYHSRQTTHAFVMTYYHYYEFVGDAHPTISVIIIVLSLRLRPLPEYNIIHWLPSEDHR